jgi:hypothetical protein
MLNNLIYFNLKILQIFYNYLSIINLIEKQNYYWHLLQINLLKNVFS